MRFGKPDHVPYFEEGIRKDVIKTWYQQGLSRKTNISDLFKTDHSYEIELDFDPLSILHKQPTTFEELSLLRNHLNGEKLSRFWRRWQKMKRIWLKKDHVLFLRVHRGFFLSMGVYDWRRFTEVITLLLDVNQSAETKVH
jgi:hypothetical protein